MSGRVCSTCNGTGEWGCENGIFKCPDCCHLLTLDNIYKNASDEELEAIVHSIVGRLWEHWHISSCNPNLLKPTDKDLHEIAKGLRKPQ